MNTQLIAGFSLVVLAAVPQQPPATSTVIESLTRRVAALESRVALLEGRPAPAPSVTTPLVTGGWRYLLQNMTPDQVEKVLGKPEAVVQRECMVKSGNGIFPSQCLSWVMKDGGVLEFERGTDSIRSGTSSRGGACPGPRSTRVSDVAAARRRNGALL